MATMNENGRFAGKVAFVTGAGSGIGRATALAFAREGARVVAVDITEEPIHETARQVEALGGRALAIPCDVRQAEEVRAALETTIETFGRLDIAFNNAGVEQPITAAADITETEWERIQDVDLRGVFLCMKYQIPRMLEQGGGAIVNTSSGAGVKGIAGQAAYCAAKWGVIGLSKAAALDYAAQHLRINVIAPGIVDTAMMDRFSGGTLEGRQQVVAREPVGRMGTPRRSPGRPVSLLGHGRLRHRSGAGGRWWPDAVGTAPGRRGIESLLIPFRAVTQCAGENLEDTHGYRGHADHGDPRRQRDGAGPRIPAAAGPDAGRLRSAPGRRKEVRLLLLL